MTTSQRRKKSWCSPPIIYRRCRTSSRPLQRGKEGVCEWLVGGEQGRERRGCRGVWKIDGIRSRNFWCRYLLSMSNHFCLAVSFVCTCVAFALALPLVLPAVSQAIWIVFLSAAFGIIAWVTVVCTSSSSWLLLIHSQSYHLQLRTDHT